MVAPWHKLFTSSIRQISNPVICKGLITSHWRISERFKSRAKKDTCFFNAYYIFEKVTFKSWKLFWFIRNPVDSLDNIYNESCYNSIYDLLIHSTINKLQAVMNWTHIFGKNFRIDPENCYKLNGKLTLAQTNIQISSEKSDLKNMRMKGKFPERYFYIQNNISASFLGWLYIKTLRQTNNIFWPIWISIE